MTFEALGVSTPICQAVAELGYEQPMPVQEAVIPHLLGEPQDLIALAQTGTGKTAAFGLPLLQNVARSLDESKTGQMPLAMHVPSSYVPPVSCAYRSLTTSPSTASISPRYVSSLSMGAHP